MGFVSTGITIEFASGFLAEILDVTPPGMSREMIDMSHQGTGATATDSGGLTKGTSTGWKQFEPARLVDPGNAEATIAFIPSDTPPILDAFNTVTLYFPDSSGTDWSFEGALSEYSPSAPFEDKMTADVTIKARGEIKIAGVSLT